MFEGRGRPRVVTSVEQAVRVLDVFPWIVAELVLAIPLVLTAIPSVTVALIKAERSPRPVQTVRPALSPCAQGIALVAEDGSDRRSFVIAFKNGFYLGNPPSNGIDRLFIAGRSYGEDRTAFDHGKVISQIRQL